VNIPYGETVRLQTAGKVRPGAPTVPCVSLPAIRSLRGAQKDADGNVTLDTHVVQVSKAAGRGWALEIGGKTYTVDGEVTRMDDARGRINLRVNDRAVVTSGE
jgi:hypothetical protein